VNCHKKHFRNNILPRSVQSMHKKGASPTSFPLGQSPSPWLDLPLWGMNMLHCKSLEGSGMEGSSLV